MCWCAPRQAVSRREYSEGGGLARGGRAVSRALRLGGKGAILSSYSNIAQVRLDLSLSCSGQVPARFSVRQRRPSGKKASQPGCPPKQGKECVQERSSALFKLC
eukprot:scaffold6454_cov113-Isochrysis_galbana.AAC.15